MKRIKYEICYQRKGFPSVIRSGNLHDSPEFIEQWCKEKNHSPREQFYYWVESVEVEVEGKDEEPISL